MSTMRGFKKVERASIGSTAEGVFATISESGKGYRRLYLSVEAREYLGYPEAIVYYVNDEGQLALSADDGSDEASYLLNAKSGHVGAEMPLQELDIQEEGRVYLETVDDDNETLVADFS